MGAWAFRKDFEPIVRCRDNVRLHAKTLPGTHYEVVAPPEPVQPFIVDFVSTDFYGAVIPAYAATGYDTKPYEMNTELELPELVFGQWRIELLDDFVIEVGHVGAKDVLYDTKHVGTYLSKELPRKTAFKRQAAADTEELILDIVDNVHGGARVGRIVKLNLAEEVGAAAIVRFGDGDGTGTDAAAAAADMSLRIGANESLTLHEEEIPDVKFFTGVTWQISAGTVRATITVEEDNLNPFKGNLNRELFTFGDKYVPNFKPINIQAVTLARAAILIAGYKFKLAEVAKPKEWTDIPIGKVF